MKPKETNQSDRFTKLARELECDEDEVRWDEKLKRIAKAPKPESENSKKG